jgi:hypothetical protein
MACAASAANATDFNINMNVVGSSYSASFTHQGVNGAFSDTFTFGPDSPAVTAGITFAQNGFDTRNMTITELSLDGIDLLPSLTLTDTGHKLLLGGIQLGAGGHVVKVSGSTTELTSYNGTLALKASPVPVPAPASWSLLIVGVAGLVVAMRARAAQTRVKLAFA